MFYGVSNHLVAAFSLRKPEDCGDTMRILAAEGFLAEELAERLVALKGLRNLIIRGYLRPSSSIIHSAVQQDLGDIAAFCQAVVKLL